MPSRPRLPLNFGTALSALLAAGCEDPIDPAPPLEPTLEIFPAASALFLPPDPEPATNAQLFARMRYDGGQSSVVTATWRSLDPSVATVTQGGLVTPRGSGSVLIVGTVGRLSDSALVTVRTPTALDLGAEERMALLALGPDPLREFFTVTPLLVYPGTTKTVARATWRSTDPNVLAVTAQGRVSPLRTGSAWLFASLGPLTDSVRVSVQNRIPQLDGSGPNMFIGMAADTISIDGQGLTDESVIRWNGRPLKTWTPFHRSLRAEIPGDLLVPGDATITVFTPAPGGGESAPHPVFVVAETDRPRAMVDVDVASSRTCSLDREGRAYCWGYNGEGRVGDGTLRVRKSPVPVKTGVRFESLTTFGAASCGLTREGEVWCWGGNFAGELGVGSSGNQLVPARVATSIRFRRIDVGDVHACGLDERGRAYCWGRNHDGRLGDGTRTEHFAPQPVAGDLVFTTLALGNHSCGLTTDGRTYCWGGNSAGNLGLPIGGEALVPTEIPVPERLNQLEAGFPTCGLTAAGAAYCWGPLDFGPNKAPRRMAEGLAFIEIAVGASDVCGIDVARDVWCWSTTSSPRRLDGGLKWTRLAHGGDHSCGVVTDGDVYCWGSNFWGQLGTGQPLDRIISSSVPVRAAFDPLAP